MFDAFRSVVSNVVNAVYNFIAAAVTSTPGGRAGRAWGWEWTVRGHASEQINNTFKSYMQDLGIKAGQFALRVNGSLIHSAAYTWAEPGYRKTETDSVMRIASCSKAFTTAAVLDLRRQQMLADVDGVFEFLGITANDPRVAPTSEPTDARVREINVRHLFEHRAGWNYRDPQRAPLDWVFKLKEIGRHMGLHAPPTKQEFAQFMFNVRLDSAPDDEEKYSNIGYLLLGMVVEKASGMSYIDFLNQSILRPLGISNVFVGATRLAGRRENEVLYEDPFVGPDATLDPHDLTPAPLPYGGFGGMTEVMDSGGGLVTSAESLARFIASHNVGAAHISDNPGRVETRRDGNMPGTCAVAECFSRKNGSEKFEMAIIFNRFDTTYKTRDLRSNTVDHLTDTFGDISNDKLNQFVNAIKQTIMTQP